MTLEIFEDWFTTKQLTKLSKNSAIDLDKVSYNSAQLIKFATPLGIKKIQNCLQEKSQYFEEKYTKNRLLEVLKTKEFIKSYKVGELG